MTSTATSRSLLLTATALAAAFLAAWLLLGGPGGPVAGWTGLDLHYLALPIALGCGLMLLNRFLLLARRMTKGRDAAARSTLVGEGQTGGRRLLASVLFVLTRLPLDLGAMVLVLGVLSLVSNLPATISELPDGPDLAFLTPYLEPFGSLAVWGVFLLLPFVLVRAAGEAHPATLTLWKFPIVRLLAFSVAYLLLADRGILQVAFDVQGSTVLLWLGLALGLSYGASTLRNVLASAQPDRGIRAFRAALIVMEGAWIAALIGAVAALPSSMEPAIAARAPEGLEAYLSLLRTLTPVAAAVFLPFLLIRAIGVFVPVVDRAVGFPTAHLLLFLIAYTAFSQSGVVATALEFNPAQLMVVLTQALLISYAAIVMRNVARIGVPGRYGRIAVNALALASPVVQSAALALAVLVALNHLPVVNALMLDHSVTEDAGIKIFPVFGSLFEARYLIAALCFVSVIATSLPRSQTDNVLGRYSSMLVAALYGAIAFLAWATGTSMSNLGHGLVLGGALAGVGMYLLALSHLAVYVQNSSIRAVADIAGWLAESRTRALVLGMNVAFYILLLRPVLYEYLWLAPLFEYAALLVLMLVVLMRVVEHLRAVERAAGSETPVWTDWSHHRQTLESRPDRRMEVTAELRQAFVDRGEWKLLWTYLMGLLHRSEASIESIREVCRPLRNSASSSTIWSLLRMRKWARAGRAEALEESLRKLEQSLESPTRPPGHVGEDQLREAAHAYVESGTDLDWLAVALITAHCQRGESVGQAVDWWFHLLEAPDAPPRRFRSRGRRSLDATADGGQRRRLVEDAISQLPGEAMPRDRVTVGGPA